MLAGPYVQQQYAAPTHLATPGYPYPPLSVGALAGVPMAGTVPQPTQVLLPSQPPPPAMFRALSPRVVPAGVYSSTPAGVTPVGSRHGSAVAPIPHLMGWQPADHEALLHSQGLQGQWVPHGALQAQTGFPVPVVLPSSLTPVSLTRGAGLARPYVVAASALSGPGTPRSSIHANHVEQRPSPVVTGGDDKDSLALQLKALRDAKTMAAAQVAQTEEHIAQRQELLRKETYEALQACGLAEALRRWPSPDRPPRAVTPDAASAQPPVQLPPSRDPPQPSPPLQAHVGRGDGLLASSSQLLSSGSALPDAGPLRPPVRPPAADVMTNGAPPQLRGPDSMLTPGFPIDDREANFETLPLSHYAPQLPLGSNSGNLSREVRELFPSEDSRGPELQSYEAAPATHYVQEERLEPPARVPQPAPIVPPEVEQRPAQSASPSTGARGSQPQQASGRLASPRTRGAAAAPVAGQRAASPGRGLPRNPSGATATVPEAGGNKQALATLAQAFTPRHLRELRQLRKFPPGATHVLEAVALLLGEKDTKVDSLRKLLQGNLNERLRGVDLDSVSSQLGRKVRKLLSAPDASEANVRRECLPAVPLAAWCAAVSDALSSVAAASAPGSTALAAPPVEAAAAPEDSRPSRAPAPATAARQSGSVGEAEPGPEPDFPPDGQQAVQSDLVVVPDLSKLGADELRKVRELTVIRPDVGCVTFHDLTDCTRLDVKRLVRLELGQIIVYPQAAEKPKVGEGLNKKATVTLYQCFPPDGRLRDDAGEHLAYRKRIQLMTEEKEACTFIDYDCVTGVWKFQVEHF